ncbi:MAG: hypothetical protein MI747_07155, partial [Desulfobacterales bacterium]|nr:hypothetical protein [Desulfobacterales bacterium]
NDSETFKSQTRHDDTLHFSVPGNGEATGSVVGETTVTSGGTNTAAAIVSSLTVTMDPGMSMASDQAHARGIFGTAATAVTGGSIVTLGGEDGFKNFNAGDKISFELDGQTVSYTVSTANGGTTQAGLARQMVQELKSDLTQKGYTILRNGNSVSIIKSAPSDDPIKISSFTDTGTNDARLQIRTGTGEGTHPPKNDLLMAGNEHRNSSTSSLYDNEGKIRFERLDANGNPTGSKGIADVSGDGRIKIYENGAQTLSFDLSKGDLTQGNTMVVDTDGQGRVDPLDLKVHRRANSVNETYDFKVVSGGTLGQGGDKNKPIVLEYKSTATSGRIEINPKEMPARVKVDGMLLVFNRGTLTQGDHFTIKTDDTGEVIPKDSQGIGRPETGAQWHWTLDSFAAQLNRKSPGVEARVTSDNRLVIQPRDYYSPENMSYSGKNGVAKDNTEFAVKNWS